MPSAISACAIRRIRKRYFLSRSRAPALVEPDDILEYDLDSNPIVPPVTRPYSERVIHGEIFKARPDVNAVCHHHAPPIMPFAISGVPLVPVFHLGAAMGRYAPFWDSRDAFGDTNLLVVKPEEGASLARALGTHAIVVMRRHGATVVGGNLRELVFRTIYSAKNAEHQLAAAALGNVVAAHRGRGRDGERAQPRARAGRARLRVLGAPARRARRARQIGCRGARGRSRGARAESCSKQSEKRGEVEEKRETKGEETMSFCRTLAVALFALGSAPVAAQDTLKIAIGQINNWENQAPTLGEEAGIFKKHNLKIESFGTQGAGETIQAVVSGSADLGAGVGVAGVMRAFSRGAPVRVLLPAFTGTGDLYWYVKADSPIKQITDATAQHSIAYSTSGSSSHNIVVAFGQELGVKAKATATGGPPATFTQVMTGQIDIGWSAPPFGLKEIKEGKIRIVARGSDIPSLKGQTVRAIIVNANALKEKRDAIMRFAKGYREAVDWMYADPKALAMYSEKVKQPVDVLQELLKEFHPKSAMQTDTMADLDGAVADAVKLKFLDAPLGKEQLAEFLQIPPK